MGNTGLQGQLEKRAAQITQPQAPSNTIEGYLMQNQSIIAQALPKHMNVERLTRIALTVIRTNPKLKVCTLASLAGSIMQAAMLGLEPGQLGHCYFVPFKNKKKDGNREYWEDEVQFIIGYKGMIDLARRSGNIESIIAREVCENDHFKFELGLVETIEHRFDLKQERGAAYAYYAVAKYKDGGHNIMVMSKSDIEKHRARSKSKDNGPWKTDYDEMAKKTVIRALFKYLPISVEVAAAVDADGGVNHGLNLNAQGAGDVVIDYTPEYDVQEEPVDVTPLPEGDELDPNKKYDFE